MKKCSKSLSLLLMGSLSLGVSGCGDETIQDEFRTFSSLNECVDSKEFTSKECTDMVAAARRETPQFTSKTECEQQFGVGNCESGDMAQPDAAALAGIPPVSGEQLASGNGTAPTERRSSSWMPLMAGYMMGRYMSGGNQYQGSQPLFKGPDGQASGTRPTSFRTADGQTLKTDSAGRVSNPGASIRKGFANTAKPAVGRTSTSSRGGFGASSGSKSFGS